MVEFDAVDELKKLVGEIEGKMPTDLTDLFDERVERYLKNGIVRDMHVGRTEWTLRQAAEWLLSMFIGIVERGRMNPKYYNAFGVWLRHVYHFVIENKANLR